MLTLVLLAACTPAAPRFAFKHTERRGRFANGLRFVLMPDATTQQIEVDVRYDVGAREDPDGKARLAHLVEHLMFEQRPDGPASPPLMQSINELSTSFNAYTSWDKTHYMTGGRGDSLDALLKIEAMLAAIYPAGHAYARPAPPPRPAPAKVETTRAGPPFAVTSRRAMAIGPRPTACATISQ